jgi:GTP pyrophosphokinase
MHDVVEDCPDKTDINEIKKLFGERTASLVSGLTKMRSIDPDTKEEESIQNMRRMFISTSDDIGVIFVKLSDRLHNMRTIFSMPSDRRRIIAHETMKVFVPLAQRLGIQKMKEELEDLSFQCLDPHGYKDIKSDIEKKYGNSRDCIDESQGKIRARLNEQGIKFAEDGRVKTVPSVYKKIMMKGKPLDEVYDFYAIRYIVNTVDEVYIVLRIVHELFKYIQGRFKDYISVPKPNGYRSLHTVVVNDRAIPFEVQIRTWEMHDGAEFGAAAHWQYSSQYSKPEETGQHLKWLDSLVEAVQTGGDRSEYEELLSQMNTEDIFVYTPKGDVKFLPKGSTTVDFAYAIHSGVGNKMIGAEINGVISPIDAGLENGQVVSILTSNSSKGPDKKWLELAKTGEAKYKIRHWLRTNNRIENISAGQEAAEKIFKQQSGSQLTKEQKQDILDKLSKREGFESAEDFYNEIGSGGVPESKLALKMREEAEKTKKEQDGGHIYPGDEIIIVEGKPNSAVKLSKCCNPLPGDDICGFETKGHGISVHKSDCANYLGMRVRPENKSRLFGVFWNSEKLREMASWEETSFKTVLTIKAVKDERLMFSVTDKMVYIKVPVHSLHEIIDKHGDVILKLMISVRDNDHAEYVITRLKEIKNIKEVSRTADQPAIGPGIDLELEHEDYNRRRF